MRDDRRFIEGLGGLALGVWLGGMATIAIATPVVFKVSGPDRKHSGEIVSAILDDYRRLEFLCAAAILLGSFLLLSRPPSGRDITRVAIAALMAAFVAGYSFWIAPTMLDLRNQISSFDLPARDDPNPLRRHFDQLHRLYEVLMTANLVLGLILWTIWRRPQAAPKA